MLEKVRTMLMRKPVCVFVWWLHIFCTLLHFSTLHWKCQFLISPWQYNSHPQGEKLGVSGNWSRSSCKITTTTNTSNRRRSCSRPATQEWKRAICSPMQPSCQLQTIEWQQTVVSAQHCKTNYFAHIQICPKTPDLNSSPIINNNRKSFKLAG